MDGNFANTAVLTKFMLRRERFPSAMWVLLLAFAVIALVPGMYFALPAEERFTIVDALAMPAMVSMIGPAFATHTQTYGALYTNFMILFTILTVGIMNIFLIIRLTRADEEKGRYEVLRSLPLGRLSNLAAALITAVAVNVILSLIVGLGMFFFGTVLNDTGMCLNGSLLWGAVMGVTGLVFASVAALFAQLTASARTAMSYSFLILGVAYLLRAPGDMDTEMEIFALISPLGLPLRAQPYIGNHWWPVLVMVLIAAVVSVIAFRLNFIRDIEQGLIPARRGREHGSWLMKTPSGLAFKLMRTSIIAWLLVMFALGASYGTVLGELDEFIATNDMYQQLILGPFAIEFLDGLTVEETVAAMRAAVAAAGFTIPQLFSSMIGLIMGMFVTVPAVLFVFKAKSEETDIRTELILATPVKKTNYLAGYVAAAFIMTVLIQIITALGLYSAAAAMLADPADYPLSFAITASLVYIPAIWVKVGLAVLIVGLLPKSAYIIWTYFGYSFFILFFGKGFGIFPEWSTYLSPYAFVPQLPLAIGESINPTALIIKVIIAAALTAAGFYFYNKRDINAITH
jgi:ABC-2 type transport system permease protein